MYVFEGIVLLRPVSIKEAVTKDEINNERRMEIIKYVNHLLYIYNFFFFQTDWMLVDNEGN